MRQFPGNRSFGRTVASAAVAMMACAPSIAAGPMDRPSIQDSFRLGSGSGVLCHVQSAALDPAIKGMFDRAYSIVCRDAAVPVGKLYALRKGADDPLARVAALRGGTARCGAAGSDKLENLGAVAVAQCKLTDADVDYRVYSVVKGKTTYVAEGLTGYDSAIRLGLRTIVADRIVPGEIAVAVTAAGDPAAFARVQAGAFDLDQALAEGYRRNNSGNYAEAAEFFDTLLARADGGKVNQQQLGEYVVNRALQKSNLGDFAEADALFEQVSLIPTADPVQLRLRRNFIAMHLINQRRFPDALARLAKPLAPVGGTGTGAAVAGVIDADAAAGINSSAPLARALGAMESAGLTPEEKAAILDAQARQLGGTVLRLQGDGAGAQGALSAALADLMAIRDGRVTSITRLRAQTMAELSAVAEAQNKQAEAEALLRDGLGLLQAEYPRSAAVSAATARLAGFLARRGRTDQSLALYREVVATIGENDSATIGFENLLSPYFALLARQMASRPELVDDFFLASETLVRPGVADTQAVLARELSGGSDDAARLFRQSVNLNRDIERNRIEHARLSSIATPTPEDQLQISQLAASLKVLESDQVATQAKLSQYPRYRALSTAALSLTDLRKVLRPGEAYLKLAVVGNAVYGVYISSGEATAWLTGVSAKALDEQVAALRDTISVVIDGQPVTYPFDIKLARRLFVQLMAPIAPKLANVDHLIFEPDGAMLSLPASVLVTEQAGVDAYLKRVANPQADEFDFTGVAWLGKRSEVSTAVSARAFRDVRLAAPSGAAREYLGLGQNAPVSPFVQLTATRSVIADGAVDCEWPLDSWNRPIAATELKAAQTIIGGQQASVITGKDFTDTGLLARQDLNQYRIVHFATHGLVTAPRPECPARPALLTSFGGAKSDGLLTFKEVYDLRLDADLVILSACDTAGKATVAATREAGVTVGGGSALDGLVRAFIGAGGRSVLASHWPLPDDFQATERMIERLFASPPGTSVAAAMRDGQRLLMADAATSHPYYWAGLAVIGDGGQAVLKAR